MRLFKQVLLWVLVLQEWLLIMQVRNSSHFGANHVLETYENLKNVLFSDSAVAGESAGLAMGLTLLGTGSAQAIEEMLHYAHETQHEKIIRGLAVGIALIMYGREEEADVLIEQLSVDKVRRGNFTSNSL